jgi:hypothetical protein
MAFARAKLGASRSGANDPRMTFALRPFFGSWLVLAVAAGCGSGGPHATTEISDPGAAPVLVPPSGVPWTWVTSIPAGRPIAEAGAHAVRVTPDGQIVVCGVLDWADTVTDPLLDPFLAVLGQDGRLDSLVSRGTSAQEHVSGATFDASGAAVLAYLPATILGNVEKLQSDGAVSWDTPIPFDALGVETRSSGVASIAAAADASPSGAMAAR